jgi:hypothetical protein
MALAAAYDSTLTAFASLQLELLRADHLSSRRTGSARPIDADDAGHARIVAAQKVVLSWKYDLNLPTADDLRAVHAIEMVGGGKTRTQGVRAGKTAFTAHFRDVPAKLDEFCAALVVLAKRSDLSAVAKAGWAGRQFKVLLPFPDGNGRIGRALVNLFLARGGVPFVVGFAASESQRAAYIATLVNSHKTNSSRPFTDIVMTCVMRGWAALDTRWASAEAPALAAAGAINKTTLLREMRDNGECVICLDAQPECALLCCGSAYHMRCLSRWVNVRSANCPHCRAQVTPLTPPPSTGGGLAFWGLGPAANATPDDDTTVAVEADDDTQEDEDDTTVAVEANDDAQEDEDDTTVAVEADDDTQEDEDDTTVAVEADDDTQEDEDDTTVAVEANDDTHEDEDDTTVAI